MKSKKRLQRGGEVAIKFTKPEVSETSANSAIKGSMENQKENNAEMSKMNKEMAGGGKDDVTVPQMDQAGDSGNESIMGGISNILKGAADSEFDGDIQENSAANSDYTGGRRKSRRRKRRTRRRRKSKKRRKSRKKKSSGRKSRRKTRRRGKNSKKRKLRRRTRRRRKGGKFGGLTSKDVANYNKKKMSRPKEMISDAMAANLKRRQHKKEAKRLGVADFITIG